VGAGQPVSRNCLPLPLVLSLPTFVRRLFIQLACWSLLYVRKSHPVSRLNGSHTHSLMVNSLLLLRFNCLVLQAVMRAGSLPAGADGGPHLSRGLGKAVHMNGNGSLHGPARSPLGGGGGGGGMMRHDSMLQMPTQVGGIQLGYTYCALQASMSFLHWLDPPC
jgi:hypothetical protein